jgi:hypothetical protein
MLKVNDFYCTGFKKGALAHFPYSAIERKWEELA